MDIPRTVYFRILSVGSKKLRNIKYNEVELIDFDHLKGVKFSGNYFRYPIRTIEI